MQELGRKLTTAVARNAKVYSFGDGSQGALGHTECFGGDAYEPELVPGLPEDITSVGAGHYHSMAVTQSGHLWAWGRNAEGQLGERDSSLLSRYRKLLKPSFAISQIQAILNSPPFAEKNGMYRKECEG